MPIYEYECATCQHVHEAFQKISDAPLSVCPNCQQATLRKQMSATAFRLKGDGWYETDFKKTGKRNLVDTTANTEVTDKPTVTDTNSSSSAS